MQPNVWYKASDLMNALGVKETRTKELLINISMSEENACYWTEVIRKGQFADKYEKGNNKNEADYFDDSEVEMFKAVKYLPSEILVLTTYELYKRCAVQNKITQIRDLERQKEWFGYRGN